MAVEDENRASESSTEAEDQFSQDANTAESSDADPGSDANTGDEESSEDLLSVVKNVVKADDEEGEDSESTDATSPSESEAETGESSDEDEEDDESDEDEKSESEKSEDSESDSEEPFHKHPAWQRIIRERDGYKEKAENFDQIQGFMDQHGLSNEEVAEGFQIMSLMKNDPATAYRVLNQKIENLRPFDPNYIPPDVQKEVDDGLITPERAQELAHARARENQARLESERYRTRHEQDRQRFEQDRQKQRKQALATAVDGWEQRMSSQDPDYAEKAPWVLDRVKAMVRDQGEPDTPDAAVQMVEQAYSEIDKRFKQFTKREARERKRESKPMPSSGGSSETKPEPESVEDAVRQAVGK